MKTLLMMVLFIVNSSLAAPIDEIKFVGEGLSPELIQQLRTLTGFIPGDDYEKQVEEKSLTKMREYLENKGYPRSRVEAHLSEEPTGRQRMRFQIELGIAEQMKGVEVQSKSEKFSEELRLKILKAVDLKSSEFLDRDRIKEMKRTIEVLLIGMDFIDSKVTQFRIEKMDETSSKVVFTVDLGQQVVFSVNGNEYFSKNDLSTLIQEQRQIGLGRDYVSVLINRIKEHYRDYGFRSVEILPYFFESSGSDPRKVSFEISEGPRIRIGKVFFEGAEIFSVKELENLFFKNAGDRIQAKIFNEKMLEEAAGFLVEELKDRGYLSAKLIAIKTEEVQDSKVNVRIFLSEGSQTIIQSIDFSGNQSLSSEELKTELGLVEDRPLSLKRLESGLDRVRQMYRDRGYMEIRISNETVGNLVTYSERNQFAFVNIELEEGVQWFYEGAQIYGIETTKPEVIEREIQLTPGEPVSERKILGTEDRLRRLGLFNQVSFELIPGIRGAQSKILKISVSESVPGSVGLGIGLRNDLGLRLFGEMTYSNLWGKNHSWVINLSGNRRWNNFRFVEFAAQTGYIWPWFAMGETTFRPNFLIEKRQYREFDAETFALSANFDRMILNRPKLFGSFTYTIEQIRQFNATDVTQNQQIRIGSMTPQFRIDLRDNPINPRNGFFSTVSFEYANSFLGSQVQPVPVHYGRFQTRNDFYFDFIPRVTWYSSIRGGWLKNFASALGNSTFSIPLIKQFALGGVNSMRGYLEQEINVQANDKDRRVQNFMTYVNYRTQLDFFASQNLSLGPFMDAGNLNVDRFSLGGLEYGTGVGLRYLTPVGPVNFDWGFKLFPKTAVDTNVFYFSLGVN